MRARNVLSPSSYTTPYYAVNHGVWTDADLDGFPDAGETVVYNITVQNAGTVTLLGVEVTGTSGAVNCDQQPDAVLPVGESYECETSQQVWVAPRCSSALTLYKRLLQVKSLDVI